MTMNALEAHHLMTLVVGSISFLIAVVVIWRARYDDAPHPAPVQLPQARTRSRHVIFAAVMATGWAWPTSVWAAPLHYCSGPLWYLMVECWFV